VGTVKSVKDELDMLVMLVLGEGEDEYVVQIDDADDIKEVTEGILNECLESGGSVSKAIRDDEMFKESQWCPECHLPFITLFNLEVAIGRFEINNITSLDTIKQIVDKGNWVSIFLGDGIKTTIVDTQAELASLLSDEEDWGTRR
jgi:hypothetical protein